MFKKPKVSVLMPVYNTKEAYLRTAIESILKQTFNDFEFLIMNDNSTNEDVEKVIRSYKDKRIVYSKNTKNLGISGARNKLIDMAKGDYLAVMDHDDESLPDRFEKQVKFLDAHPDVGVVGSWAETFPVKRLIKQPETDEKIKEKTMVGAALVHPASMIRKKVLTDNKIGYEEVFSPAEDYALWARLIPFTKFHNLQEVLFHYREHQTNTFRVQNKKIKEGTAMIHAFVRRENPQLWERAQALMTHVTRVSFLGVPFLTIRTHNHKTKVSLFKVIPLLSWRDKNTL